MAWRTDTIQEILLDNQRQYLSEHPETDVEDILLDTQQAYLATNDPYNNGVDAYCMGIPLSENPHPKETNAWQEWNDGWKTTKKTIP